LEDCRNESADTQLWYGVYPDGLVCWGVPTILESDAVLEEERLIPLASEPELLMAPSGGQQKQAGIVAQAVALMVTSMSLAVILASPALICVHFANTADLDIWWHLRVGELIQQHHAVPHFDPFSGPNAGKPWEAYSWLYELLIFKMFSRFGLSGIVGYSAAMVLAIAVAFWHLIKRLQPDFSMAALLMFVTFFSLQHLYTPRPWMFTILFFVLEIDILMVARKTGRLRELALLPLVFALWSNIHIQFIDGLLVLGLAAMEAVLTSRGIGVRTRLRAPWIFAALGASIVAAMANPFGWHIYRVAYDLASQPGVLNKINELQAIPFRDVTDFATLFLALTAAAALAWQRRFLVFEVGLLAFATVVSFRSKRDIWVMAAVAAAILASSIRIKRAEAVRMPKAASALAIAGAALIVLTGFRLMHVDNAKLADQVANVLPVAAADDVQAKGYAGPLFNDFDWGGYLIWALRMPVSIDGRAAFYGDQAIDRSIATWSGTPDWNSDPQLKAAGLVIGPARTPLVQLLRLDPHFQLVYEDKLTAVFIARR